MDVVEKILTVLAGILSVAGAWFSLQIARTTLAQKKAEAGMTSATGERNTTDTTREPDETSEVPKAPVRANERKKASRLPPVALRFPRKRLAVFAGCAFGVALLLYGTSLLIGLMNGPLELQEGQTLILRNDIYNLKQISAPIGYVAEIKVNWGRLGSETHCYQLSWELFGTESVYSCDGEKGVSITVIKLKPR